MMNKTEKKGCRIILNYLTDEEIFSLLDTITKRRIKRNTKEEAIDAIISFTDTAEQFLQRQKIKSEVLLRYVYLQPEKVYPSAASTKKTLIDTILKVWGKKDSEVLNKRCQSWVSSSFDDFGNGFSTKPEPKRAKTFQPTLKSSLLSKRSLPVKRKLIENVEVSQTSQKPVSRRPNKTPETILWSDKHSPKLQVYPSASSSEKKKMKTVLKTCGKKDSEMLNVYPSATSTEKKKMNTVLKTCGKKDSEMLNEQQTPLHIAARLGNVDNVVLLLQHGAKPDATTKDLYTPLHIASKEGHEEVASVLLDNEANLNLTTKKGFTPLYIAAKYGQLKVAKLLLQKDANPDVQGKNGLAPLHVATHYNHVSVALLLLNSKASPHSTAKNGYTPLHIAAEQNQMDIATTLLEYSALPDAELKNGFTPIHLAAQEGHMDMVSLLLEHKATVNCKSNGIPEMAEQPMSATTQQQAQSQPAGQQPQTPATGASAARQGATTGDSSTTPPAQTESSGTGLLQGPPAGSQAPDDSLAFLRSQPQFRRMRDLIQQDPSMVTGLLEQIGQSNPRLLQIISRNQEEFIRMLNEQEETQVGGGGTPIMGEGSAASGGYIQVTQQEKEAIDVLRLKQLGFSEADCIQAYFACEKNEDLAANYLFNNQGNDDEDS